MFYYIRVLSLGALLIAGAAATLSGCQSPQERSGRSPIPQNRPADWENQKVSF
jgi:hypothetical protein